jgi:hypothetical protein
MRRPSRLVSHRSRCDEDDNSSRPKARAPPAPSPTREREIERLTIDSLFGSGVISPRITFPSSQRFGPRFSCRFPLSPHSAGNVT